MAERLYLTIGAAFNSENYSCKILMHVFNVAIPGIPGGAADTARSPRLRPAGIIRESAVERRTACSCLEEYKGRRFPYRDPVTDTSIMFMTPIPPTSRSPGIGANTSGRT